MLNLFVPWKAIYSFDKGRQAKTEKDDEQDQLKATLKKYMTKKAKELNKKREDA